MAGGVAAYVTGRFEHARQQRTLEAELRKDLITQRRQLLNEGALLIVDVKETVNRLLNPTTKQEAEQEWESLAKKLSRFGARVDLWFDEGNEVAHSFKGALDELQGGQLFDVGRDRADDRLRAAMIEEVDSASDEAARSEAREKLAKLNQQQSKRRQEAEERVKRTLQAYQRAARDYLAGDVRGG